ncbi:MAG: transcription elongation factor GreA [Deltaproteobacteria bacterium]|nr:transcription elongation factor GreA [Deltaproteobacteria bacterium]
MERNLLTREGHAKLLQDLKRLRQVELPSSVKAIEEARAHGDLSENAEYHAAKERNAMIMGKINELDEVLATAEVVAPPADTGGRVVFGVTVTVFDTDNEEECVYQIVGSPEADATNGRISITSPIGQALLGKEEGDEIRVKTPGGIRTLEVVSVSCAAN